MAEQFPQLPRPFAEAHGQYVLLELSSSQSEAHAIELLEASIGAALEEELIEDAVVASSVAQSEGLWQLREHIPLAQAQAGKNIKHDISLPISVIADFIAITDVALATAFPGCQLVCFGHLGDGNLHYNVAPPPGMTDTIFLANQDAINRIVHDQVPRVWRLDFGRTRHRRAEKSRPGPLQVAAGTAADARHQAGAGPAKHHESGEDIVRALIVFLLFAAAGTASAQTAYKCVQNGQTSYSETPCAAGQLQIIEVPPPPPAVDKGAATRQQRVASQLESVRKQREAREDAGPGAWRAAGRRCMKNAAPSCAWNRNGRRRTPSAPATRPAKRRS